MKTIDLQQSEIDLPGGRRNPVAAMLAISACLLSVASAGWFFSIGEERLLALGIGSLVFAAHAVTASFGRRDREAPTISRLSGDRQVMRGSLQAPAQRRSSPRYGRSTAV